MKRKSAKEILIESFHELAEKKTIDTITIREITDNCGYSPATFYRQSKDKYDMIAWDYICRIEELKSQFDGSEDSWKQSLIDTALLFQKERTYMSNLFLHTSGFETFISYMREKNFETLKGIISQKKSGIGME